ncbi:MAG: GNAT family N-acetyltransferase [Oscillospiraceae bacterium]|nr:GNAT family N-acetyltransferase [Oscillospiraceae bacterium]
MDSYEIKQIHADEYEIVKKLDHDAFEYNERGSDGYWHEVFGDNIRRSPYYIPELELVAVMDEEPIYLGHAIFSALPMGDGGEHIVWLNSLAVKHGKSDSHADKTYEYQRKGVGTALVKRGLEIAKSLGYTGCMVEGHPDVYRRKMGFSDCRDFGIATDGSVDGPEGSIHAIELVPGGFDKTNKLLSYSYYDFFRNEALIKALGKMFDMPISKADYKSKRLHGGTVGEVRLVSGTAVSADGMKLPYNVVLKIQKKWDRLGDSNSWRREYDLYMSDFGSLFTDSLRWPECYHAEMNGDESEWQIWMEHIDGVSGRDLTVENFERAAFELGRWQGKLYAGQSEVFQNFRNLSKAEDLKNYYLRYRSWHKVYNYIRSDKCEIPKHLCQMLIEIDDNADEIWSRIEALPVVLCHRDFWVTNIFFKDGKIILIDWDTAGWGYIGEDIKSLVADEADVNHMVESYRRCVPAYYKGFSEYADVTYIKNHCIREMILVNVGYRLVEWIMDAGPSEKRAMLIETLQKIYEM